MTNEQLQQQLNEDAKKQQLIDFYKSHANMQQQNHVQNGGTCPNCGYCPHCGRGRQTMPVYPHWPPYTITWTGNSYAPMQMNVGGYGFYR